MTDLSGMTPAEQWRLVDPMDAREGDEYLSERYDWRPACEDSREFYAACHLIVRRRIDPALDPAEPLRREMREAYGILDRLYNLTAHILPKPERWPVVNWLKKNAGFGPGGEGE